MTRPDSWEGAIVRGRDGRKGRVVADGLSRLTRAHRLLVHWDDDTLLDTPASVVTMLRPPVGFTGMLTPARETRTERLERTGPWWAGLIGLLLLLGCVAAVVWALSTGAL